MSGRPPLVAFTSRLVPMPFSDVDTDQIIPAPWGAMTSPDKLREGLFRNRRLEDPQFPLNRPELQGRTIILAGPNFGCGSSRETAVWALQYGGFKAVISTSFGDIFAQNSLKNGLLPVVLDQATMDSVSRALEHDPDLELTIDLAGGRVFNDGAALSFPFAIESFARRLLLLGMDELDYLLGKLDTVDQYERSADLDPTIRARMTSAPVL